MQLSSTPGGPVTWAIHRSSRLPGRIQRMGTPLDCGTKDSKDQTFPHGSTLAPDEPRTSHMLWRAPSVPIVSSIRPRGTLAGSWQLGQTGDLQQTPDPVGNATCAPVQCLCLGAGPNARKQQHISESTYLDT